MNIWMIGENSMKHHPQPPTPAPKKKKKIYSHLNMEDITDAHCVHAERSL